MPTQPLRLDRVAEPLDVRPGGEVRFKGSFHSTHDGSTIDAATTTWPDGTPGGAGVDAGGLVDFAAGGLRMTSRDPVTHEVVAVATGKEAPGCGKLGVAAPCVVLRTLPHSQSRLLTMGEWTKSLEGGIEVELVAPPPPPAYAPVADAMSSPLALGALGLLAACGVGALAWTLRRRQLASPAGQMKALVARVSKKLGGADAALAATLGPVVKKTLAAVDAREVDPTSREGVRVREVLLRVEARLDETTENARAAKEQAAADELVSDMESALEAAHETMELGPRRRS